MLGNGTIEKAWGPGVAALRVAALRRGLLLLATLCLVAGVTLSAGLLVSGGVVFAPGEVHGTVAPATDGKATERPQDQPLPDQQQPTGLEEYEDWPAKKFFPDLALLSVPFEVWDEGAQRPESAAVEAGSDQSPPQLLQRPPPAR